MSVHVRLATLEDVDGVLEIVRHWSGARDGTRDEGYLRHDYARALVQRSVERGECAVAVEAGHVLSLYLVHDGVDADQVERRRRLLQDLVAAGRLPEGRYALVLLGATREGHAGRGLNRAVLDRLREAVADRYDVLLAVASADNAATLQSGVRMGWRRMGPVPGGVLGLAATTPGAEETLDRFPPWSDEVSP